MNSLCLADFAAFYNSIIAVKDDEGSADHELVDHQVDEGAVDHQVDNGNVDNCLDMEEEDDDGDSVLVETHVSAMQRGDGEVNCDDLTLQNDNIDPYTENTDFEKLPKFIKLKNGKKIQKRRPVPFLATRSSPKKPIGQKNFWRPFWPCASSTE